jgi:hypothetical protein
VEAEGRFCEVDCETKGDAGGTLGVPVVDGDALGVPVVDGVTLERVVLPIEGVGVGVYVGVYKGVKVLALDCSSRKSGVPRPVTYGAHRKSTPNLKRASRWEDTLDPILQ